MPWIRACSVDELDEGEALQLPTCPLIALFNVDGEFFALDDTCSHGQSSLADGYLDGDQIECAWHMAKFDVRTGKPLSLPATTPVRSYEVRIEGSDVLVDQPDGE